MPFIIGKTIAQTFLERVKESPSLVGFEFKPTSSEVGPIDQWKKVTFREFYQECRLVSFGLMGLGIRPGDKVALLSSTRFEWSLSDMAILGAAGVSVPLYASSPSEEVSYITDHSESRVLILENSKQLQSFFEKKLENPESFSRIEKVVVIEPSAMKLAGRYPQLSKNVLTLQALKELGKRQEAKDPTRFDQNLLTAQPQDLFTICYTSGTTGIPKGVLLTHENLMSVLEDCVATFERFVLPDQEVVLSFLPFSHIFGRVESLSVYTFGWREAFAEDLDRLSANLMEIQPTIIFGVPRIFEKAHNRIRLQLDDGNPSAKKLFERAFLVGRRYYESIWDKKQPLLRDQLEYRLARKLALNRVSRRFGGRLRFAICGGAPLPQDIGEFFQIIGIKILEGYGLTETCAAVALNTPDDTRFGVVGRPLPEVTFKIAEDGEILVKSKKVFHAYYKREEETRQVLKDGWLYTGDIGHIDRDGFLHVTDRKKDLIVTSGGKNIAPQKIESIGKSQKLINQFVVHGDRRHYLTALITLNREQIIQYANENQILFSEYAELIKNPKILSLAQKIVDEVNRQLASFESIKKFVILPEEFTVESGELTPSLKIRRGFINKKYKAQLDSMYGDSVRVPLDSSQYIR